MNSLQFCLVIGSLFFLVYCDNSTDVTEVSMDEKVMNVLVNDITGHKVMLYSKTYCPFSKRIKALLSKYQIDDMKIMELDKQEEMADMQNALKKISGRRTVPQLFVDGEFVGGCDDTKALEAKGELKPILERAHALRR